MKKVLLSLTLLSCICLSSSAQRQRTINPADTLRTIVSNADGSTTFQIFAPTANQVKLEGDFSYLNAEFTKDENGIWRATVAKVNTDAYRYCFNVDGMKVIDPKYRFFNEITPVAQITNGEDIFWSHRDVPHGPVSQISYMSKATGQERSFHVWMPAGKNARKKLPVLYLIHGAGDNDASWTTIGCADDILDNLYAEGKIKPMIVVMPHGGMDTELFVNELVDDIMPRVADQYRIKKGSKNTALAGLSMGGLETLNCFTSHPDLFGFVNVMSSGWFWADENALKEHTEHLKQIAGTIKKTVKILRFTMGGKEDFVYQHGQNTLKCFDEAGIEYEYSETPGGHSWHVWHYDLMDFATRIFKK